MSPAIRHFARHYVEMVLAMLLGMVLLGIPAEAALRALGSGSDELRADAPALALLGMAAIMTVPMMAWMRHRGHGWTPSMEMAASMFVPTFAVVGLLRWGLVTDVHALLMVQHVVMFPSMLVAMLLRRDEYTGHVRRHGEHAVAA